MGQGDLSQQDIAILQMETALNLQPVEIGLPSSLTLETPLVVTGYGLTSIEAENSGNDSLEDTGILFYYFGKSFFKIIGTKVFISELADKRTSTGDSGGPLYERTNEKLFLHGILSGGDQNVSAYTHPYFFLDWINCALKPDEKIKSHFLRSDGQKACDSMKLQDISKLANFNKMECATQLPGFRMKGEDLGSCSPTSATACKKLGEIWKTPVEWNEKLKECVTKE